VHVVHEAAEPCCQLCHGRTEEHPGLVRGQHRSCLWLWVSAMGACRRHQSCVQCDIQRQVMSRCAAVCISCCLMGSHLLCCRIPLPGCKTWRQSGRAGCRLRCTSARRGTARSCGSGRSDCRRLTGSGMGGCWRLTRRQVGDWQAVCPCAAGGGGGSSACRCSL
jgi:hypothetical protein